VRDQAFYSAQRFREREKAETFDESADASGPAFDLETEHRPESILLLARDVVPRVRPKARVKNLSHRWMNFDRVDHGASV